MFFSFGKTTNALIDILIDKPSKKTFTVKEKNSEGETTNRKIPLFIKDQKIAGKIDIKLEKSQKLSHSGIKVELIGRIDIQSRTEKGSTFMCNGFDLEPSGTLYSDKTYNFNFDVF